MLSVVMLSVVILSVVMLSVVMLSVVMLSVVMLSVVMLSVVMWIFPVAQWSNTRLIIPRSRVRIRMKKCLTWLPSGADTE
jgi:hypothetical protein